MRHNDFSLRNLRIVLISPEGWGDNLLSKHHIALTLAGWDNKVWFISPASNSVQRSSKISENLFLIHHKPQRGTSKLPVALARCLAQFEIARILRGIGEKVDIVWSFDPYHFQFLRLFNARVSIYHPVDNHYTHLEQRILQEADLVLTNSTVTLLKLKHPNKYKIGHGVAQYFFESKDGFSLPQEFDVKVGYVGNLNNRLFAFDVFLQLARSQPNVGFYLVGPRSSSNLSPGDATFFDWDQADELPNVFWLGQQPSLRIPSFLSQMDILLVLYKADERGFTVSPHKTLEYLSSGKLVIAPQHEENATIAHLILQARSLDEVPKMFGKVLKDRSEYFAPDKCAARISYSLEMTYEKRLSEIEGIVKNMILSK